MKIMKADARTEAEVMAVLGKFAEAYEKRNLDDLLGLIAPDPDVVTIGTGADEKRVGIAEIKKQLKRDWAQSEAASMKYGWASVSQAGTVALVAADTIMTAKVSGQEMSLPGRLTAALEKRGKKWLIIQAHFSLPLAGQAEGESFPTQPR